MSIISSRIRAYVTDPSVSNRYGEWGALRADQRKKIRELCDVCDMFEKTADEYRKEIESLESRIFALNDTNKILMERQEVYARSLIEEFSERLKNIYTHDKRYNRPIPHTRLDFLFCKIDDLVKEMTEGRK